MNLLHALNIEKTWLNNIDDSLVDSYEIYPDNLINFYNKDNELIGVINGLSSVAPAPSGPGFYLVKNEITQEDVIIELKQTIPPSIR